MWKSIAANGLTFLILGLMAVAGVIAWGQNQYRSEGPLESAICLRVESGSTMRRVADDLNAEGASRVPRSSAWERTIPTSRRS
jgi:UPF0755 protein